MSEITDRLAQPFDPAIVSWRLGPTNREKTKGMALAYIDARDVMRRLDDVCGPENWQDEYPWSDGKRVVCRIGIRFGDDWVWKTDGAGDTDTEGEKGALSDAFKRSAVKWGIGRYLYDVKSPWVEIEQKGNSYIIKDGEYAKLRNVLPRPQRVPPANAAPETPFDEPRQIARRPNPIEPPNVTANRQQIIAEWWDRDDYGLDPDVIDGGIMAWDSWFLNLVKTAPTLDAFLKLKDDNKTFHARWYKSVAPPVSAGLRAELAARENVFAAQQGKAA